MKKTPKIAYVANAVEKGETYAENMRRHDRAVREGFYFEALLIEYAMIEDRLRSFLYHSGMLLERNDSKGFRRTKSQILMMLRQLDARKTNTSIISISAKEDVVRAMLGWYASQDAATGDDKYLNALWNQIDTRLDAMQVCATLDALDAWREYRNEVIHALMHKNIDAVEADMPAMCDQGMALVRDMDKYVKQIKYRNCVRRSIRLKTDSGSRA